MRKEFEVTFNVITGLGIFAVAFCAFSSKQRDSIAFDRDGGECKAPFPHDCHPEKGLEVHHVMPQRYAAAVGIEEEYVDVPENAVTICNNAHDVIHPDRVEARKKYHQEKARGGDSFRDLFQARLEKIKQRQIYWNGDYDRQLHATAVKQTQEAKKRGWEFPLKRKKKAKEVIQIFPPVVEPMAAAGD